MPGAVRNAARRALGVPVAAKLGKLVDALEYAQIQLPCSADATRRPRQRGRGEAKVQVAAGDPACRELPAALAPGILTGAIYGLMCVRRSALIFGVMRVVNFAQGEFMMLGMYVALYRVRRCSAPAWSSATMLAAYVGDPARRRR